MNKIYLSLLIASVITASCSNSDENNDNSNANQIVGTWESWKEVTDDGEIYELDENDCPTYVDVYNANGSGREKYFFSWDETDCELINDFGINWEYLGNSTYRLSGAGISADHQFIFEGENIMIQRDEENESNIYFRKQ